MAAIAAKIIPFLITVIILAVILALMMGIGWASGKLIRKFLGIGGK